MPSVQSGQLEAQSQAIAASFGNTDRLVRQLDLHFELYMQRARRPGQSRRKASLLPSYEVPAPVMRQLRQELTPLAAKDGKQGLALAEALWARRTREHRQLAAALLGSLPKGSLRRVGARVARWGEENRDERVMEALAVAGCQRMRSEDPASLLRLCGRLFKRREVRMRATGLLAMKALMEEDSVDNLPAMLDLLRPMAQNPAKGLRPYLLRVFETLAKLSPGEALYFLQQRLVESPEAGTRWLARQSMRFLPSQEAQWLEEALEG